MSGVSSAKGFAARKRIVRAWSAIPRRIRKLRSGLSPRDLNLRGGSEGWSIREYVHHLVEANVVASTIALAALGKPGCRFDWSWLWPDSAWMKRLGYDRAPLEPAIELLDALVSHVGALALAAPGGMNRRVRLVSGGRSTGRTLAQVLEEERDHADHHLRDISETIRAHRRIRAKRS